VNVKLRDVQGEKRDLEAKIRKLENELSQRPERESDYEFDFSPSDWRELAANHQIKYRIPCPMPAGLPWKMAQSEQDELGLSSEDAEIVTHCCHPAGAARGGRGSGGNATAACTRRAGPSAVRRTAGRDQRGGPL